MCDNTDRKLSFKEHSKELVTKSQELRRSLDGTMGGSDQIKELCNQLKELEERVAQLETRPIPKGTSFVYFTVVLKILIEII